MSSVLPLVGVVAWVQSYCESCSPPVGLPGRLLAGLGDALRRGLRDGLLLRELADALFRGLGDPVLDRLLGVLDDPDELLPLELLLLREPLEDLLADRRDFFLEPLPCLE